MCIWWAHGKPCSIVRVVEGLIKLYSYACEVVCGVDAKAFNVEVGEYVGGASWNFTYISGEIAQEFIIFLVSSLEEGTP